MFYISRLKKIHLTFLLILALLLPVSGICTDANGSYKSHGYGNLSCGKFVEARRNGQSENYDTWVTGYVTAINKIHPGTYSIFGNTDIHGAMLWLESYCNKNPLKSFADAVESLVYELYQRRTIQEPK